MQEIWEFKTKNFRVVFSALPEEENPADHFEFEEDVEFATSGEPAAWFCAKVSVERYIESRGSYVEVGNDFLGACSYKSFDDFVSGHRDPNPENRNCSIFRDHLGNGAYVVGYYFPDMVRQAIYMAKEALRPI